MNDIMLTRLCKIIAQTYALEYDVVWYAYQRLGSIDKLINSAESGLLDQISKL